jgi:hypothetical protein
MTRRRSRGRRGPRCRDCDAPVIFLRSPFTGNYRTFEAIPVEPSHPLAGVRAFPVLSRTAYRPADLAEQLQIQRQCSRSEAEDEVQDMPWHLIHECPTDQKETP